MGSNKQLSKTKTLADVLTNIILKGRVEAICFAIIFNFVPYLSFLSSVTVALVTLRQGIKQGLFVTIMAFAPVALFTAFQPHALLGEIQVLITFGVMWLLAAVLYQFRSWTHVIYATQLLVILIGICIILGFPSYLVESKQLVREMFVLLQDKGQLKYDAATMQANVNWFSEYFLGMQLAINTLMVLMNLGLARYMQSKVYYPGGFAKEFLFFRLEPSTALLFILCLVGVLANLNIAKNFLLVGALPLVFAGISLMHWRVRRFAVGRLLILVPSYFLLVTFPFTLVPLMGIGFADMWFDFRNFKAS